MAVFDGADSGEFGKYLLPVIFAYPGAGIPDRHCEADAIIFGKSLCLRFK